MEMPRVGREQRIEEYIAEEKEKFEKRLDDIHNRVLQLTPIIHQNLAIINRYSLYNETFLEKPKGSEGHNRRASWSGMILAVSDIESEDPIVELKKKIIKEHKDLTVLFNPESAYSLNVIDYPEIWVMHIDGFLAFDKNYDLRKINEKCIIERAQLHVK